MEEDIFLNLLIPNDSPDSSSIENYSTDKLDAVSQSPATINSGEAMSGVDVEKSVFDAVYRCEVKKIRNLDGKDIFSRTNDFGANVLHCLIRSKKTAQQKKDAYCALMKRLNDDEQGKTLIIKTDQAGYTPPDKAAFEGDSVTLEMMIRTVLMSLMKRLNRKIPQNDDRGNLSLNNKEEIVDEMSKILKVQKNRTLLHSAAAGGHLNTLEIVLEMFSLFFLISLAEKPGVLLGNLFNPNITVKEMISKALKMASQPQQTTNKALLKNQIQTLLDEKDLDGNTALHLAAFHRHGSAVDFLINKGCSLTILNNRGESSISYLLKFNSSKESLVKRLDSSIQYINGRQENRVKRTNLKMNFTTIVSHDEGRHKARREILCESYVIMLLQHLNKKNAKEILFHPLCQTFVELKLQRLRGYCLLNLLFYLFLLGCFTSFCFSNTSPTTNIAANRTTNFTTNFNGNNTDFTLAILTMLFIIPCFLSSFTFFIFYLFGLFQCGTKQKSREIISGKIGRNQQNFGETRVSEEGLMLNGDNIDLVHQSDLLRSSFKVPIYNCKVRFLSCVYNLIIYCWILKIIWEIIWENTPSEKAFVLFGLWFIFLKKIKIFSPPGLYIMVFYKVAYSFLKLFAVFSSLFLSFILVLQLLQKDSYGLIANSAIGLAMISGEYGYSDKYALLEDGFAKSLFLIVVFLLGIVLMAVFIGLSVRDASLLLNEGRYYLTKNNILLIFIAEDFGKWLEMIGICFVSEQLSIFKNLEEPCIKVSLKPATREDLFFGSQKGFQAHVQYYLFKIFGVTLHKSLLYRKFPISQSLQDQIETFLVSKTPYQERSDP